MKKQNCNCTPLTWEEIRNATFLLIVCFWIFWIGYQFGRESIEVVEVPKQELSSNPIHCHSGKSANLIDYIFCDNGLSYQKKKMEEFYSNLPMR